MKKIIIIGAGISGLSAGIYARKNGYDVTIYESHFISGGMCTSWKRKGYTFEGCFHYIKLLGKSKNSMFYDLWKQLGVFNNIKIINQDYLMAVKNKSGKTLYVYTDPDKLKEEMLKFSDNDDKKIIELCRTIKRCYWFTHSTKKNPFTAIIKIFNILSAMPFLIKYGKLNLKEYVQGFNNTLIKDSLSKMFEYDEISCIQLPMFLGLYHKEGVGFPEGGSIALAKTIEQTFLNLGGELLLSKKVKKIITENNQAIGIQLEDNSIQNADIVISAIDGHETLFELLENTYLTEKNKKLYEEQPVYSSYIQVSLGVKRDISALPYAIKIKTEHNFQILGKVYDEFFLTHYDFDKTMSAKESNTIILLFPSDLSLWQQIGYDTVEYKNEKERILKLSIEFLENILPDISSQIEVTDVSTPYTMVRYTHNWKGALGFLPTPSYIKELGNPQFKLDNLRNFYMTGQWVYGMGIPNVALGGKKIVKEICKEDGIRFVD